MSRYHVRVESAGIAREVGYNTLAEVQAVLKELDSREYKCDEKPNQRLLTEEMIREAALRFFGLNHISFICCRDAMLDTEKSSTINLFLSDLADMLNEELSK